MPDFLPSNMGAVSGYLNVQAMQNAIAGQTLENQQRAQNLEAQRIAIEQGARSRQAAYNIAMRDARGVPTSMAMLVPADQSSPEALAASEGGDQPGMKTAPQDTEPPLQPPKLSALHMKAYQDAIENAKEMGLAGDFEAQAKYKAQAETALKDARAAHDEERKQTVEQYEHFYNLASSALDSDPKTAEFKLNKVTIPSILQEYGQRGLKMLQMGGIDPTQGLVAYTPAVRTALETFGDQAMKNADRTRKDQRDEDIKRKSDEAESRIEYRHFMEDSRRAEEDLRRNGQILAQTALEARLDKQKQDRADNAVKEENRNLNKDPLYQNFPKIEMAREQAQNTIAKLNSAGGYDTFTAPDARALQIAFTNFAQGFRARTADKASMVDARNFNGALQKLDAFVESLGSGSPTFSPSTARNVANAITEMSDIANKHTVIASLQAQERATRKGANMDDIQFRGNLQRMFDIEKMRPGSPYGARVVTQGGKRYLELGAGSSAVRIQDTGPSNQ